MTDPDPEATQRPEPPTLPQPAAPPPYPPQPASGPPTSGPPYPPQPASGPPYPPGYGAPVVHQVHMSTGKDVGVAYLLWFFLGGLGAHHFYLNRPATGIALASLSILGWCTLWFFFVGLIFLIPVGIWWLVDAFLVSGWVREHNARAAHGIPR